MKFKQRLVTVFLVVTIVAIYLRMKRVTLRSPVVHVNNNVNLDKQDILQRNKRLSTTLTVARNNIVLKTHIGKKLETSTTQQGAQSLKKQPQLGSPWVTWNKMVTRTMITPNTSYGGLQVNAILRALSTFHITKVGVGFKGTQLKASMFLEGDQRVVFKPKRYDRNFIIQGEPYAGPDRHNGEIAAFHLDRLLGFYRAPPVSGRIVNLKKEVFPVISEALNKTFFKEDGNICFYGVCYYCKREEAACGDGDMMEGSVTLWLPPGWKLVTSRHPWQRTYSSQGRKARWEIDPTYCNSVMKLSPYDKGPRLTSIIDTTIFDFLIGNADRHHYETYQHLGRNGLVLHLDNGKSFGNPETDEMSILAPLYQCCRILHSTWKMLNNFNNPKSKPLSEQLNQSLSIDPIAPVLSQSHLDALDRRLGKIIEVVKKCITEHSQEVVLVSG